MGAARPPIVTLDVFLEAIVTPRFVEVVEAPEALLHITSMMRQKFIETVELVDLSIFVELPLACLRGYTQCATEAWLAALQVRKEQPRVGANLLDGMGTATLTAPLLANIPGARFPLALVFALPLHHVRPNPGDPKMFFNFRFEVECVFMLLGSWRWCTASFDGRQLVEKLHLGFTITFVRVVPPAVPERESRPQATMIRVIKCVGLAHKTDTLPGVWVTPRLFVPSKLVILVVLHCSAVVLYSLLR